MAKRKIKIKDSLYVLENNEGNYVFIHTSTRRIKEFKVNQLVRDVIDNLPQERYEQEIFKELSRKYNQDELKSCLDSLEYEGIIERYTQDFKEGKNLKQILFINELSSSREETLKLQEKIEKSKVAVFGIGGIGTWMVNGLNQIGIGEIRISDPDIIDVSNLNRQLYFDTNDIGKYKVDVIKSKISDANIVSYKKEVSKNSDLEEIIHGCDFVVNCADSPSVAETTRIIDSYASKEKIPYMVSGGYNLHLGMVGPIIITGVTKSFDDFLRYQKENDPLKDFKKIKDIRQTGNIGPVAGVIANLQVMEIFKYLTGKGSLNLNKFAEIDFMDLSINWREF